MIQLLNIAGTGPIFGALMGAVFGPVVFLWIVFGSIRLYLTFAEARLLPCCSRFILSL